MGIRRLFCACACYEFLTTATEGVVHSVHKVVIHGDIRGVKVLVVLPFVSLMPTEGELRLTNIPRQWRMFEVLSSYCY